MMKRVKIMVVVMVVMLGMVVEKGKGHAMSSPSPTSCGSTFFSALVQMIPCRAAVAPFSPIPPSDACCTAVKSLGQPCLCVLVNGPPISGVDRNMALQLPDKCVTNFEPCEISK
ncbi:Bifunctional inhibitor/lipid-transfer protein/seed storage 2S albumin superfamily protein [Euphorbia peplus]|nr:Bifunctional inhibitor/lipid-transfer protein/seed storage 2S albumin superfamily protein [Euphorbia peplus]